MSDPVEEALAGRAKGVAPSTSGGDEVARALEARATAKERTPVRKTSGMPGTRTIGPRAPDVDIRRGEAGLAMGSGAAATAVGGVHGLGALAMGQSADEAAEGVKWWQQALTYQPRTAVGADTTVEIAEAMGSPWNPASWPGRVGEYGAEKAEEAGLGPGVATVLRMAPEVSTAFLGAPGKIPAAARSSVMADARATGGVMKRTGERIFDVSESASTPAGAAVDPLMGFGSDSASAAAASQIANTRGVSQELITDLRKQLAQGPLNPEAVSRQLDADTLPIGMRLTEGQASGDVEIASREFNAKGRDPEIAQRFNEQNQHLIDNLDEIRRQAAPQAVAHDPVQSGQNAVDAYKRMDEAVREPIDAAYADARALNGGDLPMDGSGFVARADQALKKAFKTRHLPAEIAGDLAEFRDGAPMNFEQWESLRTTLAEAARKASRAGDGNASFAIGVVRDALEATEPVGAALPVKEAFDRARSLAKARFDRIKADPAYKAAIDDDVSIGESSPLADKFVEKYIVKGKRAYIEQMVNNLSGDELAMETIRAAPFNYMKQRAGIDPYRNTGDFSEAGYNKALAELTPRLDLLVGDELAETAQKLGRVAYSVKRLPSGNFANRSHTFVAAAAEATKGLAERGANTLIGGNIVPVGTWAREKFDARAAARESQERLRPAAGTLAKDKKP